jgi:NAD+ kinase
VVALGGDGLMLQTLHRHMRSGIPIYGMHRGTVGFLMNEFSQHALIDRLDAAKLTVINPLLMRATDIHGKVHIHTPSMKSRCSGKPIRPRGCASLSMNTSGWPS